MPAGQKAELMWMLMCCNHLHIRRSIMVLAAECATTGAWTSYRLQTRGSREAGLSSKIVIGVPEGLLCRYKQSLHLSCLTMCTQIKVSKSIHYRVWKRRLWKIDSKKLSCLLWSGALERDWLERRKWVIDPPTPTPSEGGIALFWLGKPFRVKQQKIQCHTNKEKCLLWTSCRVS